jgi:hypothetical protein
MAFIFPSFDDSLFEISEDENDLAEKQLRALEESRWLYPTNKGVNEPHYCLTNTWLGLLVWVELCFHKTISFCAAAPPSVAPPLVASRTAPPWR